MTGWCEGALRAAGGDMRAIWENLQRTRTSVLVVLNSIIVLIVLGDDSNVALSLLVWYFLWLGATSINKITN